MSLSDVINKAHEESAKKEQESSVITDINKRWEEGIPHHTKSKEVGDLIFELDTYGAYSFGGDGDNGEEILYYLDIYFEMEDEKNG